MRIFYNKYIRKPTGKDGFSEEKDGYFNRDWNLKNNQMEKQKFQILKTKHPK